MAAKKKATKPQSIKGWVVLDDKDKPEQEPWANGARIYTSRREALAWASAKARKAVRATLTWEA